MYISFQNNKIVGYTEQPQDLILYNLDRVEETDEEYIYDEDLEAYTLKDSKWDEKQKRKHRQELDALTLTPADVERALYKAKGMDFEDLKALIVQALPTIDIKALSIEFRAKDFYRGAMAGGMRLFDVVGALLNYSSDDMDYLFQNKELPIGEPPENV